MTWAAGHLPGVSSGVFDGSGGRVAVLHQAALKPTGALSLALLVYRSAWSAPPSWLTLISCTEAGGWNALIDSAGLLTFSARMNGVYKAAAWDCTGLSPGWHAVALTASATTVKVYVDGAERASSSTGGSYAIQYAYNNAIFIGAEADSNNDTSPAASPLYFSGRLAEVLLYSRELSATEVGDIVAALFALAVPAAGLAVAGWSPQTDPYFAPVPLGSLPVAAAAPAVFAEAAPAAGGLVLAGLLPGVWAEAPAPLAWLAVAVLPMPAYVWEVPPAVSWQQVYVLTLTGAADGVDDVVIPMESFQCRARKLASTYVGAQVPYTAEIAEAIADRPNGTLVIRGGPRFADGTENLTEIVRADLSRIDTDRGGRSASIALQAYAAAVARPAQTRSMSGVSYVHTGASNQIRCSVDIWLRPGDTAVDPVTGLEVVAESISYVIGPGAHVMTVSDGNG